MVLTSLISVSFSSGNFFLFFLVLFSFPQGFIRPFPRVVSLSVPQPSANTANLHTANTQHTRENTQHTPQSIGQQRDAFARQHQAPQHQAPQHHSLSQNQNQVTSQTSRSKQQVRARSTQQQTAGWRDSLTCCLNSNASNGQFVWCDTVRIETNKQPHQ
jgi:hypothetical protein